MDWFFWGCWKCHASVLSQTSKTFISSILDVELYIVSTSKIFLLSVHLTIFSFSPQFGHLLISTHQPTLPNHTAATNWRMKANTCLAYLVLPWVCLVSHPENKASLTLLALDHTWPWHHRDLNSSGQRYREVQSEVFYNTSVESRPVRLLIGGTKPQPKHYYMWKTEDLKNIFYCKIFFLSLWFPSSVKKKNLKDWDTPLTYFLVLPILCTTAGAAAATDNDIA